MPIGDSPASSLDIIRALRHAIKLIELFRQYGNVTNIVRRRFRGDDLLHVGIAA